MDLSEKRKEKKKRRGRPDLAGQSQIWAGSAQSFAGQPGYGRRGKARSWPHD
jgi:hypothetical protein